MSRPPTNPKLYHIVHVDRLASIVADERLLCDAVMMNRQGAGTTIGMSRIKQRRLQLALESRPGLRVGECVPFYYCPRSVMLYLLHRGNDPDLNYQDGQNPIVHLQFNLNQVMNWAEKAGLQWAITLSNAGARDFEDRCTPEALADLDWNAIRATQWSDPDIKHRKQAEFLVEREVPWNLVERIGVMSNAAAALVSTGIANGNHQPVIEIKGDWYY